MAKTKKQRPMRDLGKENLRKHLILFFPFLKRKFRKILESDLNNEETFEELFPGEKYESAKIKAIYELQK
jgi:hypothetical protein